MPDIGGWFSGLSPEAQAAFIGGGLQAGGGLISGIAQGRQAQQDRQLNAAQMAQNQNLIGLNATQMDPLAQQKSREKQALLAAIMPQLRNAQSSAPGGVPMPQRSGGIMNTIPMGGFSQDTLNFFSPQSRANAEGNFYSAAAPFMAPPNLSQAGYGDAGIGPTGQANSARTAALQSPEHQALLQALGANHGSGSGFWHKLAKIAGIIGGGAATLLTGGAASPALIAALGIGSGAASAWGSGAGVGGTLLGGATGGLLGGFGGGNGAASSVQAPQNLANSIYKNQGLQP